MNAPRAASRRHLSSSPFNVPEVVTPAEHYDVKDQVTHDKYGLGLIIDVEAEGVLLIDFGTHLRRIRTPCAKLIKL